jgi:hypothetical protein
MKKVLIYILASLLLCCYFRDLNLVRILLIIAGLTSVYCISRLPERFVIAAKYPIILLSFAGTAGFFLYPRLAADYPVEHLVVFLSF